jgi:signal transduction histidine kinase
MQFIETIAGSLLASGEIHATNRADFAVMKERLHQVERAQLSFAAAASHELRTPLHQINAAATLLRHSLHAASGESSGSLNLYSSDQVTSVPAAPIAMSPKDHLEAVAQLEIIETNGMALGSILENIIDTLDVGRMTARMEESATAQSTIPIDRGAQFTDLANTLEDVIRDAVELETKARRVAGVKGLEDVEIILEMLPRVRGGWLMATDGGPLARSVAPGAGWRRS